MFRRFLDARPTFAPENPSFCCVARYLSLIRGHQTLFQTRLTESSLLDGLADCLDPDCCLQLSCQNHLYCKGSPDPVEVLSQSPSSLDPQRVRPEPLGVFAVWV